MSIFARPLWFAGFAFAVLLSASVPPSAVAQVPERGDHDAEHGTDAPPPSGEAEAAPDTSIENDENAGLPETPDDRAKVLESLYAHLATADSEESAQMIAQSIERIWLHSGSDTVALLMERAVKVAEEKRYDLAIELLDTVVVLAPDFAEGWNRRALVHYLRDELGLALGDLRRALALEPNHFKALDGLVQILREMGEKKAALKALQQLLEVHPFWPGGQQTLDELARDVEGQRI